ncbi:MAG: ATP-binding protein [Planctomycetota bacterium]
MGEQVRDPAVRKLRLRYILGLGALVIVLAVAQAVVQTEIHQRDDDSARIEMAGSQRMLSQRIAKSALALSVAKLACDEHLPDRWLELRQALRDLEDAHVSLRSGDRILGFDEPPPSMTPYFIELEPAYSKLRAWAAEVLILTSPSAPPVDHERLAAALDEIERADSEFLPTMQLIIDRFETDSRAHMNDAMQLAGLLFFVTLLVLVAEALFVFEPAVRHVRNQFRELQLARDAAEASAKAKNEFLANMSHEIRTPMTAILGYADVLVDSESDEHDREDAAQAIQRQGAHLLSIINDILDSAKLDANKFEIRMQPTDLPRIMADVCELLRFQAGDRGVELGHEIRTPVPSSVRGDEVRIKQILLNLVGNAVKFTERGSVTIALESGPNGRVRLGVIDTGPGLTEKEAEHLFQPFHQVDNSATRKYGGTGLGLSISMRLARLMSGTIEFEHNPGGGAQFWLVLPIGTDEPRMLASPTEAEARMGELSHRVLEPTTEPETDLKGLRILVVEDGTDNQRLVNHLLRRAGAKEIVIAENGRVALDATANGPFDVILMDMHMPVLDGIGTTRELRGRGYSAPILALTANTMTADIKACLDAGCDGHLGKPIDRTRLINECRLHADRWRNANRAA